MKAATDGLRCSGSWCHYGLAIVWMTGVIATPGQAQDPPDASGAVPVPISAVRLQDDLFRPMQVHNDAYLVGLDPHRLLWHSRRAAGLPPRRESPYGGWDTHCSGMLGHYLSACALAAASGNAELAARVDLVVQELAECQRAQGSGGIFTSRDEADYWFPRLARGEVDADRHVVPWYTCHKIMAGLRDAWVHAGNATARETLLKMSRWVVRTTAALDDDSWQKMLDAEHGAPHEVLVDVYRRTGDRTLLDCARRFRHDRVFRPLAAGDGSVLPGLHANTQVPKFVAYTKIHAATQEPPWLDAARSFWEETATVHAWANGGNSQRERFFDPHQFEAKLMQPCGPETCNTYNMLRLSRELFLQAPEERLIAYYERALYNHILPSIDPVHSGGFCYYTPLRPGHYRAYSRPEDSMWCCVGTGMENPGRYAEMIYSRRGSDVFVNLFIASELKLVDAGISIRQETGFPDDNVTVLTVQTADDMPREFGLHLRCPDWTAPTGAEILLNGRKLELPGAPIHGRYAVLRRKWRTGDRAVLRLPMQLKKEPLAPGSRHMALFYGPILLAATMGSDGLSSADFHVGGFADGVPETWKTRPLEMVPVFLGDLGSIHRADTPRLAFRSGTATWPQEVELLPLYAVHHQRFAAYLPERSPIELREEWPHRAAIRRVWGQLEPRTVDRCLPGNASSELDHNLTGLRLAYGQAWGHGWRHASDGGWFSLELAVRPDAPTALSCLYWGGDRGDREFEILVSGTRVASVRLTGQSPGEFIREEYPIPPPAVSGASKICVRFQALPGKIAGGVYDIRTVVPGVAPALP